MRLLVTGHKGYIGSHLYSNLRELGHDVAGIDLQGCSINGEELPGEDICEGYPVEYYQFMPECIFHLAAIPRVGYSIINPVEVMNNNVMCTTKTLRFAKVAKSSLVYSSSSSVMGNGSGPTSPYALSKYVGELESVMYNDLYDVQTVNLRYFNVYSHDQKAEGAYATAVSNWMKFIRSRRNPFITGDGTQRRDMAHVDDVVAANIYSMENISRLRGGVFDVGTGENISLNEMRDIVLEVFPDIHFEYTPSRLGEVLETKAEIKNFKKVGWSGKIPIKEGIKECFEKLKGEIQ